MDEGASPSQGEAPSAIEILGMVMGLVESSDPFLTAAAAYRDKAKTHGFSDAGAETMSIHFHARIMALAGTYQS